jgi:hypothetical protein
MTELTKNPVLSDSAALLLGYGFDLGVFEVDELVSYWSSNYPPHWLRAAILEALHQGRYKAISVGQILVIWRRRGQPLPHYSYEFERAVSSRFPASRGSASSLAIASSASTAANEALDSSHRSQAAVAHLRGAPIDSSGSADRTPPQESVETVDSTDEPPDLSQVAPADLEALHAPRQQATATDLHAPHEQMLDSGDAAAENPADLPEQPDPAVDSTPLAAHPEPILPQAELDSTALPDDATLPAVEPIPADPYTQDAASGLWGRANIMHLPIHQYVPLVPRFETSTFYAKLRAVASDEML